MSAWEQFYEKGLSAPTDSVLGYAIVAVKKELAYNGFGHGMILDTPVIGDAADKAIRAFQNAHDLVADGIVGPFTAEALFRKRSALLESAKSIPAGYLCRLKTQESGNDPAAVGDVDPDDHGLIQINLRIHPDVTLAQATDPSYCLPWGAQDLAAAFASFHDWPTALASYNVGLGGARRWLSAGKPATGGPSDDPTLFTRATLYVYRVLHASC